LTPQGKIIAGVILAAQGIYTYWDDLVTVFDNVKTSVEKLLEKLGLLKKEKDIALDFSIQDQSGQVFTIEELRRRTAAFKGTKIVPKKQLSPEEREGRARMAKGKAEALAMTSFEPIKVKALGVELDKIPKKLEKIDENFESSFDNVETYFDRLSRISESIGRVLMAGAENFKDFADIGRGCSCCCFKCFKKSSYCIKSSIDSSYSWSSWRIS
jgi:hypothetical protein